MAEIVNLRRTRKAKQRREGEAAAAANRQRFGTVKRLRDQARLESDKACHKIEGHKLESEDKS
jgi:hypothetical protein